MICKRHKWKWIWIPKRHKWIWIPKSQWTFDDKQTGELCTVDIGVCERCRAKKARVKTYGPGEQVDAMLWGGSRFEVRKVKE